MPFVTVNGVRLSYTDSAASGGPGGPGVPVLLVSPAAARASVWAAHQVPALLAAGFRVVTFDNRGSAPSDTPPGPYRVADLVADTAGLIRALGIGPCHVVGASLGAMVAQELALVRPDLVRSLVLLSTRGRTDFLRAALATVSAAAVRGHTSLPPRYVAVNSLLQLFSPATLCADTAASDWLDLMLAFPQQGEGAAMQYEATAIPDRLAALTAVTTPTLVIAFTDDVIMPVSLVREVADAIPDARFAQFDHCGHFGFLERPDEVDKTIVEFLLSS
jgi:pimeloyl-ACP methyl ester carboxylesterase